MLWIWKPPPKKRQRKDELKITLLSRLCPFSQPFYLLFSSGRCFIHKNMGKSIEFFKREDGSKRNNCLWPAPYCTVSPPSSTLSRVPLSCRHAGHSDCGVYRLWLGITPTMISNKGICQKRWWPGISMWISSVFTLVLPEVDHWVLRHYESRSCSFSPLCKSFFFYSHTPSDLSPSYIFSG